MKLDSPEGEGKSWVPVWLTIPVASKACSEFVKCGCKSERGCRCAY